MTNSSLCHWGRCERKKSRVWKPTFSLRGREVDLPVSKYCEKHSCHAIIKPTEPDAGSTVSWSICDINAKTNEQYCSDHLQCHRPDCAERRVNGNMRQDKPFCILHKCVEPQCSKESMPSSAHSPGSPRCAAHKRRCLYPSLGCEIEAIDGGTFCNGHTCKERGCPGPSRYFERWCGEHKPCAAAGCMGKCAAIKINGGARGNSISWMAYCNNHLPVLCAVCGTGDPLPSGVKFCASHLCRENGCSSARVRLEGKAFKEYCEAHNCHDHTCLLPIHSITSLGIGYCYEHECSAGGCTERIWPGKPFCDVHCCDYERCPEKCQHIDAAPNAAKRCKHHDPDYMALEEELRLQKNEKENMIKLAEEKLALKKKQEEEAQISRMEQLVEKLGHDVQDRDDKIAKLHYEHERASHARDTERKKREKEEEKRREAYLINQRADDTKRIAELEALLKKNESRIWDRRQCGEYTIDAGGSLPIQNDYRDYNPRSHEFEHDHPSRWMRHTTSVSMPKRPDSAYSTARPINFNVNLESRAKEERGPSFSTLHRGG